MAQSQTLGALIVSLAADTTSFVFGLDKAGVKARQTAKEIEGAFEKIGDAAGEALGEFGAFGSKIGAIGSGLGSLFSSFSVGGSAATATLGAIAGISTAAIGAAAGMSALAIEGGEVVERLSLLSQKTGIGIRDLQLFEAAGKTVNLSLEEMVAALRKFDQGLTGSGKSATLQKAVLDGLGVTSKDNKEALFEVADAFSKMDDGARKNADAVALFGRAGLAMIPFLNKGRDGILEMQEVLEQYGPKVTREAIDAQEKWKKSTIELSLAWDNFKVGLTEGVLPRIAGITTAIAGLTKAMGDLFGQLSKHSLKDLFGGLGGIGGGPGHWMATLLGLSEQQKSDTPQVNWDVVDKVAKDDLAKQDKARNDAAKELYETEKAGGAAAYALEKQRETIAAAVAVEHFDIAARLQKQIPTLEEAARLEKERQKAQFLRPKVGEKPVVEGLLKTLQEEASAQLDAAAAATQSAGAYLILNAIQAANLKIAEEEKKLNEEKAQIVSRMAGEGNKMPAQERINSEARLGQIDDQLAKLKEATPQIQQYYAEIAGGKGTESLKKKLAEGSNALQLQSDSLDNLVDAYSRGAAAVRSAALEDQLTNDKKAVVDAQQALDTFSEKFPNDVNGIGAFERGLKEANATLDEHRRAILEIDDKKFLVGVLAQADAFGKATYQIEREIAGLRKLHETGGNSPESDSILYSKRIDLMEAVEKHSVEMANTELEGNARFYESQNKLIEQWDAMAIKWGSGKDKFRAVMNELTLEGQNFGAKLAEAFHTAVDGMESELAKLVVTGKANFKQVLQSFEESVVKAGIQKVVGGIAQSVNNKFFGGMIPGLGTKADGSSSAPFYVVPVDGGGNILGKLGGLGGGGGDNSDDGGDGGGGFGGLGSLFGKMGGGIGSIFKGIGGIFSKIFGMFSGFLAGGGDVTPGRAYIVGEKHPEFFVPNQPGHVAPSLQMGAGPRQTIVNFHVHGVKDVDSFRSSRGQIMADMHRQLAVANGRNG